MYYITIQYNTLHDYYIIIIAQHAITHNDNKHYHNNDNHNDTHNDNHTDNSKSSNDNINTVVITILVIVVQQQLLLIIIIMISGTSRAGRSRWAASPGRSRRARR